MLSSPNVAFACVAFLVDSLSITLSLQCILMFSLEVRSLVCGIDVPEAIKRNDAIIPKGRVYMVSHGSFCTKVAIKWRSNTLMLMRLLQ